MRLATLSGGGPDGRLIVVSVDGVRYLPGPVPTLQAALDAWAATEPALRALDRHLAAGDGEPLDPAALRAPLPRAWQWLDGSAFPSHGQLMQAAFKFPPIQTTDPLMYQGLSDHFLGPNDDVPLPSEDHGIDFEGEFAVVTDAVPMGVTADAALGLIRLVVQINDWSLRTLAAAEIKTGFGWVQAKPACSMAPFALTPDALGDAWRDGRVAVPLVIEWNGERFGAANGGTMAFGFHDLIAHAARTRRLSAGTIIGSGTVSNDDFRDVGSSCIAERRGIEMLDRGVIETSFMSFGERVRMEARSIDDRVLFGAIEQRVVSASARQN